MQPILKSNSTSITLDKKKLEWMLKKVTTQRKGMGKMGEPSKFPLESGNRNIY